MRGRREKHIIAQTRIPGEITAAREHVESKWFARIERDDALTPLVTAQDGRREPFHRWLVFKQAFSPGLVRRFLATAQNLDRTPDAPPLLDPFSGTGTFVTECARANIRAIGVEAISSLAFINAVKSTRDVPSPPDVGHCGDWQALADRLTHPLHRAALICAIASVTTGRGAINKSAPPIADSFRQMLDIITEDLRYPLARANLVLRADARDLASIADESIGGILTSPPYLSRHNYAKLTQPFESVYARFAADHVTRAPAPSLPASTTIRPPTRGAKLPPSVVEACDALIAIHEQSLAKLVRAYFHDMFVAMEEWGRILRPGAPCWIVIGGARLKDVYLPVDTILADEARSMGYSVNAIMTARNLVPTARKFGRLMNVAPRESIIVLKRI